MNHHDAEMTDVVVMLEKVDGDAGDQVVRDLQQAGLSVSNFNPDQRVVEGSIESQKVHDLKHVRNVRYVRPVMSYTVDYPPGDPRDKDGPEEVFEDGEE